MWAAAPLSRPENVRSAVRLRSASPPKWRDRSAEWEGFGLENRKKTLPDLADDGLKERTKKRMHFPLSLDVFLQKIKDPVTKTG